MAKKKKKEITEKKEKNELIEQMNEHTECEKLSKQDLVDGLIAVYDNEIPKTDKKRRELSLTRLKLILTSHCQ
jgi:Fe-S cluster assembly scaffold protein SufB